MIRGSVPLQVRTEPMSSPFSKERGTRIVFVCKLLLCTHYLPPTPSNDTANGEAMSSHYGSEHVDMHLRELHLNMITL
jgi:hypothetical protein